MNGETVNGGPVPASMAFTVPPASAVEFSRALWGPDDFGAKKARTVQLAPAASRMPAQRSEVSAKCAASGPTMPSVIGLVDVEPMFVIVNNVPR